MNRDDRYDTGTMESIDTANLMPLSRMSDFKVADNDQDVRGWKVIARDGDTIGKVDDLLIDTTANRVRFLGVDLDRGLLSGRSHSGKVLIPIESVRLDRHDRVLLDSVGSSEIMTLPTYDASSFGTQSTSTASTIEDGEIRVPLSHEEVIVEKRVVPKEELVIKKHQVQGEQVVEEDVRRERVEVNRTGDVNLREDNKPRRQ